MANFYSIEDQIIALLKPTFPTADFSDRGRLGTLLALLMTELGYPGTVPESVFKAIRAARDMRKRAGAGIHKSMMREVIRRERSSADSAKRFPELAKLSEEEYLANAEQRLMIPAETVRNYLYGKRGTAKKKAKRKR